MASKVDYGAPPQRLYWLNPRNGLAARRFARWDRSVIWRRSYERRDLVRSRPFSDLLGPRRGDARNFRFAVLADSGEGGNSQYALLPWLRSLELDFLVINGDVAYPAGRPKDFVRGFFDPYRELGIPIWATPGNHEYYSRDKARTFYDIFCCPPVGLAWSGMPHVPMPGSYWELRSPEDGPLVVIGVDTGMKGNLDGDGFRGVPDGEQLGWLRWRLRRAEEDGKKVILLCHFPPLDRGKPSKTALRSLVLEIAKSSAVRLVLCGHVHNLQIYEPDAFCRFLEEQVGVARDPDQRPVHYLIAGGGGAYLADPGRLGPIEGEIYPDGGQWRTYARRAQRIVHGLRMGASVLARLASLIKPEAALSVDAGQYMNFVVVEVEGASVRAVPVRMTALEDVIEGTPGPEGIPVRDPQTRIRNEVVQEVETELATGGIQVAP